MSNPGLSSYNLDTLPVAPSVKASTPDVHAHIVKTQKTRRAIAIAMGVLIVGALAVAIFFIVTNSDVNEYIPYGQAHLTFENNELNEINPLTAPS